MISKQTSQNPLRTTQPAVLPRRAPDALVALFGGARDVPLGRTTSAVQQMGTSTFYIYYLYVGYRYINIIYIYDICIDIQHYQTIMIYYVTAMKPNDANHKPCHWDINNLFAITTVTDKHRDIKTVYSTPSNWMYCNVANRYP